jgi:16S rRNA G966 N2-methylase RsmD
LFEELLKPEVISYILENENADTSHILLKHKELFGLPASTIVNQIKGRSKAKHKLPAYYRNTKIVYPPQLNLEQSSSERTAIFKKELIERALTETERKTGADLSGGFGTDSFFMSAIFKNYCYVEPNLQLLEIAQHNHQTLNANNISYQSNTASDFLAKYSNSLDFIFIDPSRRSATDKKVSSFEDCEPNIISLQDQIYNKTSHLLVKASPLIDLHTGLRELKSVKNITVLSVDNECREVLFYAEKNFRNEPLISAVNLTTKGVEIFEFLFSEEASLNIDFSEPETFLFEPNASILKAGAFKSVAQKLNLKKLHPSTHLYTSSKINHDFPGRIFKIIAEVKPDPKSLRQWFPDQKANVTTRNYPLTVAEVKKKTGLKDGGEKYLFGFTGRKQKYLLAVERLN